MCIDCGGTGTVKTEIERWEHGFLVSCEPIVARCKCHDADFCEEPTKPQHQRPNVPPVLM